MTVSWMICRENLTSLHRKLPPEMKFGEEAIKLDDHETYRQAMGDVKHLLLAHLLKRGTGQ